MKAPFLAAFLEFLFVGSAAGIVIDDFSVGGITLSGPTAGVISQTALDSAHVVGGARHILIEQGPVQLSVDSSLDISVSEGTDWGYYQIMYGYGSPLQADFTAGGHDRIRLVFNDLSTNWWRGGFWVSVNTQLPSGGSAPGPNFLAVHGGGIFEIPFSRYSTNFANVNTFAITVVRMENLHSFSLEGIVTAGTPISGDFDRNGVVDTADLAEWQRTYGRTTNTYGGYLTTDDNLDGRVDGRDFLAWQRAYAGDANLAAGAISVPEPTALVLFVGAIFCSPAYRLAPGTRLPFTPG